jgi:hypothetical protein
MFYLTSNLPTTYEPCLIYTSVELQTKKKSYFQSCFLAPLADRAQPAIERILRVVELRVLRVATTGVLFRFHFS